MTKSLQDLARRQDGVFTRQDARACELPAPDLLRGVLRGHWVERHPQVYLAATQPPGPASECRAALLAIGAPCALAGRSAAWVWRLPGFEDARTPTVVVPGDRRYSHLRGVEVRRVQAAAFRTQVRRGWPVTPLEVTVRDLAAELTRPQLRELVQQLVLDRRTTLGRLRAVLGRGLRGSAALRRLVDELDPRFHSRWERRLYLALRRAGLHPQPQLRLRTPGGRHCYLDLGFPEIRFGVEVDGFLPHMRRFAADRRRSNEVCLELRWELAHFAVADLVDRLPEVVASVVRWVQVRRAAA